MQYALLGKNEKFYGEVSLSWEFLVNKTNILAEKVAVLYESDFRLV